MLCYQDLFYVAKKVCVMLQSFVLCCQDSLCSVAKICFMLPSFVLCCQVLFYVAKRVLCYVEMFCFMLRRELVLTET